MYEHVLSNNFKYLTTGDKAGLDWIYIPLATLQGVRSYMLGLDIWAKVAFS